MSYMIATVNVCIVCNYLSSNSAVDELNVTTVVFVEGWFSLGMLNDLFVGPLGVTVVVVNTFWSGQNIIIKIRGPNRHTRTAKALSLMANDITADWNWASVVKYVIINAIHIRPSENVKFWSDWLSTYIHIWKTKTVNNITISIIL